MNESHKTLYSKFNEVSDNYKETKKEEDKKILASIHEDLDKQEIVPVDKHFMSYPDYHNPDFIFSLSQKAEFFYKQNVFENNTLEKKCSSTTFELGNHQQFLQSFINKKTNYKGLLVFHGVGVGKTCSAITISNSFRDSYKAKGKRIICLVAGNIQPGWKKTIYDYTKGENQCTGDTYHDIIMGMEKKTYQQQTGVRRKVNKMIKDYYEFYGYREFSGKIKRLLKIRIGDRDISDSERKKIEKEFMKEYFSDRLLIVDEVHNLRNEKNDNHAKETLQYLDKVIKYSVNLRLILLSATPLFNQPSEVIWLVNMLLKNDNRPILRHNQLFDENKNITEEGISLLIQKTRGYISYLRGENPITFPIRLYPDSNKDKHCLETYPLLDIWNNEIPKENAYKFMKLYASSFTGLQKKAYESFIKSIQENKNLQITESKRGSQISNIVYPTISYLSKKTTTIDLKTCSGSAGLHNIMNRSVKNNLSSYSYKQEYLDLVENSPMFEKSNIKQYSSKINSVLEKVSSSEGIVFIYSQYLSAGLIPMALALEHMGFTKYGSENLLSYKHKGKQSGSYILLSGDITISPNNQQSIQEITSPQNKDGSKIKVVLGSVVASEGLDLKNIREIHIIDPWFHLFRVEQIIGRGIRFCSHMGLEKKKRNVTIYQHVGVSAKSENESVDIFIYRQAEQKARKIGHIEHILKQNSIDCLLNKGLNVITKENVKPITLQTSQGNVLTNFNIHDKPYSKMCSFQETCDFPCSTSKDFDKITNDTVNFDTFNPSDSKYLIQSVKHKICKMYELFSFYSLQELEKEIDMNPEITYHALDMMVQDKDSVWNSEGKHGYLFKKQNLYVFQPSYNDDPLLPIVYRHKMVTKKTTHINISSIFPISKKVEKKIITGDYQTILKELNDKLKETNNTPPPIKENGKEYDIAQLFPSPVNIRLYILHHYLDTLTLNDKITILRELCIKGKKKHMSDIEEKILSYFSYNLIKKSNHQYHILDNSPDKETIGFFLLQKNKGTGDILKDFIYFIYDDDTWKNINDLDTGEVIKKNIKANLNKLKKQSSRITTHNVWVHTHQTNNGKPRIKLVDNKKSKGGIVLQDKKEVELTNDYLRMFDKDIYASYIEHRTNVDTKTKIAMSYISDNETAATYDELYKWIEVEIELLTYFKRIIIDFDKEDMSDSINELYSYLQELHSKISEDNDSIDEKDVHKYNLLKEKVKGFIEDNEGVQQNISNNVTQLEKNDRVVKSKSYVCLVIEMIFRTTQETSKKNVFLPYDLYLLK